MLYLIYDPLTCGESSLPMSGGDGDCQNNIRDQELPNPMAYYYLLNIEPLTRFILNPCKFIFGFFA